MLASRKDLSADVFGLLVAASYIKNLSPLANAAPQVADVSMTNAQRALIGEELFKRKLENQPYRDMKAGRFVFEDPFNGEPVSFDTFLARSAAKAEIAKYKTIYDTADTVAANRQKALNEAAASSRNLLFDIQHNLYGQDARDAQSLSTWLNSSELKDLSGPALYHQ